MLNSYMKGSAAQNMNDTRNATATSILPPEITSTPLLSPNRRTTSPLVTPRKFNGPRRYALSSNGVLSPMKTLKDPPGPLLASTSYNVNVSTYIDTKSSGYAGRLVQYSEEHSRNHQRTHQEKYGSPGLFPIVHLFKKDIPVISPKPKKVTVRIGTPELRTQYSQEHNRQLLEGIVRSNSVIKEHNSTNEVSTRSVLDALKEISRKRIHASEELTEETNKKLRRDCVNGDGDSSKRGRVDSPTSDSSVSPPTRQATKKLRTIDPVLASKTSSMYAGYDTGFKRKTIEDAKVKISPVNKKKFNNAETQTNVTTLLVENKRIDPEPDKKQPEEKTEQESVEHPSIQEEVTPPPKQVLKIFDDKPLEIIRKNRLGALLSALTGHEIPAIPMEDRRKALDQDWPPQSPEKKLVSILSPQNKQPRSVEKHVTFSVPDNSNSAQSTDSTIVSGTGCASVDKNSDHQVELDSLSQNKVIDGSGRKNNSNETDNQTSSILAKTVDRRSDENIPNPVTSAGFKIDSNKTNASASSPTSVGGFKFDLTKPITSVPQATTSTDKNKASDGFQLGTPISVPKSKVENTKINFGSPSVTSVTTAPATTHNFSSKFTIPLSKSNSSPVSSTKTSFEGNVFSKSASPSTNSLGLPISLSEASPSKPSFGVVASSTLTFGTTLGTNSSSSNCPPNTTPVFAFGGGEAVKPTSGFGGPLNTNKAPESSIASKVPTFGSPVISSSVVSNSSSFGISKSISSPLPAYPSTGNVGSPLTIGTNASISAVPASNAPPLNSNKVQFGVASPTVPTFGASSNTPSFEPSASKNLFSTTAAASFGGASSSVTTSAPNFGATTSSGGFNFSSGNSLPAFGNPVAPSFSATSSAAPINAFGASSSFGGAPSNVSFGGTKTTTASFSTLPSSTASFGTTSNVNPMLSTSTTPSFGANPSTNNTFGKEVKTFGFGSSNNLNLGNPSTSANTTSMFTLKNSQSGMTLGTNTTASTASNIQFGSNTSTFGAVSSNMFPSVSSSTFGQTTTTPTFGTTNTASFGTAPVSSAFGTSNNQSFGVPNTTAPNFGGISSPTFGAPSTTATSMFSTTNTPGFGTTNTTASGFSTTNTLSFGSTNTQAPTFGTNTTTFGATNTQAPAFETNTPSFGATNTQAPAFGTNTPTFGASTTPSLFGVSNAATFGNATTTPGFGTTNTPSFGSSNGFNVPSFGSASAPFGAATTSANTFNSNNVTSPFGGSAAPNSFGTFGSTSSPFNPVTTASSFGTSVNNNFGSSNAAGAFGGSSTPVNAFGGTNGTSSPFGAASSTSTFGNNNAAGSNTFGSGFGAAPAKPEQSSNIFPSQSNNMFGSNTFAPPQPNNNLNAGSSSGVFTFGSPNAQPSPSTGVFAFGTTEPPKSFNFSAPGTSGSAPAPLGGGFSATPALAQPSSAMPNMFSIGSGASSSSSTQNRSRPVARARRRT